jgi:hypothetical protein
MISNSSSLLVNPKGPSQEPTSAQAGAGIGAIVKARTAAMGILHPSAVAAATPMSLTWLALLVAAALAHLNLHTASLTLQLLAKLNQAAAKTSKSSNGGGRLP